jgi:hypothetical protein
MNPESRKSALSASARAIGQRGRRVAFSLLAAFLLISFIGALAVPAHAADDSNAGQLTEVPTVTSQQLGSALSTLEQGNNDSQIQQLLSQFQSELNSGDYSGAASTLVQLQGLSQNNPEVSPALNALIQSLSVGPGGATVNANTLSSLLNNSFASGASAKSQQDLSLDMQSLASLMQFANSTLASQLLQNSDVLSQNAFAGSSGSAAAAPIALPGVSGFSGLSMPAIGTPSLSVGTPSGGVPAIPLAALAATLAAVVAVVALYFSRGRIVRLVGSQSLPGIPLLRASKAEEAGPVPADARARIEYYFGRAVSLMSRRGVRKLESETHREFSSKCERAPEGRQVGTISSLYEKAKFSGQEVGSADASLAASSFTEMEKQER